MMSNTCDDINLAFLNVGRAAREFGDSLVKSFNALTALKVKYRKQRRRKT